MMLMCVMPVLLLALIRAVPEQLALTASLDNGFVVWLLPGKGIAIILQYLFIISMLIFRTLNIVIQNGCSLFLFLRTLTLSLLMFSSYRDIKQPTSDVTSQRHGSATAPDMFSS